MLDYFDQRVQAFNDAYEHIQESIPLHIALFELAYLETPNANFDPVAAQEQFKQEVIKPCFLLVNPSPTNQADYKAVMAIKDVYMKILGLNTAPELLKHENVLKNLVSSLNDPITKPSLISCLFKQPFDRVTIFKQMCDYAKQAGCLFDDLDELIDGSIFLPPSIQCIHANLGQVPLFFFTGQTNNPQAQSTNQTLTQLRMRQGIFAPPNSGGPTAPVIGPKQTLHQIMLNELVGRVNQELVNQGEDFYLDETSDKEIIELLQRSGTSTQDITTLDQLIKALEDHRHKRPLTYLGTSIH